jgi:hypothetical protein
MRIVPATAQRRRDSMRRSWLIAITLITILALIFGAIACGDDDDDDTTDGEDTPAVTEPAADEIPAEGVVNVSLTEYVVTAEPPSVTAGSATFNAENIGGEIHELVIIKTDLASDALPVLEDGSVDETGEGIEVIDEIEEFDAGGSESLTVDLEAGAYALICNVVEEEDGETESHYAEGMHAPFTVTE